MGRWSRVALVGCLWPAWAGAADWIVVARHEALPPGIERHLERAGGQAVRALPTLGAAAVTSADPAFRERAARIPGVGAVIPDVAIAMAPDAALDFDDADAPPSDDDDPLRQFQWGLDAVGAPGAWAAGLTGAGVRVAVMDQGVHCDHPDLAEAIDVAGSASFIEGEGPCNGPISGSHGDLVSGIVAAADNGIGVVGVAPGATVVSAKVFPQASGSTPASVILEGLAWLATADVDVVNMSFSEVLDRRGMPEEGLTAREVAELVSLFGRALGRVHASGAVLVASSGNRGIDRDHDRSLVVIPADSPHVIAVSATAPVGFALDPDTDLDVPAPYSNHGRSAIDLAAPGGNLWSIGNGICSMDLPCRYFDLVLGPTRDGWGFGLGTSFAAPHVAGVAALLAEEAGPDANPGQVEGALRHWAEDLGDPGRDPWYGHGRTHTGY